MRGEMALVSGLRLEWYLTESTRSCCPGFRNEPVGNAGRSLITNFFLEGFFSPQGEPLYVCRVGFVHQGNIWW